MFIYSFYSRLSGFCASTLVKQGINLHLNCFVMSSFFYFHGICYHNSSCFRLFWTVTAEKWGNIVCNTSKCMCKRSQLHVNDTANISEFMMKMVHFRLLSDSPPAGEVDFVLQPCLFRYTARRYQASVVLMLYHAHLLRSFAWTNWFFVCMFVWLHLSSRPLAEVLESAHLNAQCSILLSQGPKHRYSGSSKSKNKP